MTVTQQTLFTRKPQFNRADEDAFCTPIIENPRCCFGKACIVDEAVDAMCGNVAGDMRLKLGHKALALPVERFAHTTWKPFLRLRVTIGQGSIQQGRSE